MKALHTSRREIVVDAAICAALIVLIVLEQALVDEPPLAWLAVALAAPLIVAVIVVGRRWPLAGLYAAAAVSLGYALWDAYRPGGTLLGYLPVTVVASYLVGRRMESARPALLSFAAMAVAGILITTGFGLLARRPTMVTNGGLSGWVSSLVIMSFLLVVPWLVGRYRRQQEALIASGWQRARELELRQRAIADRERLAERTRIAEDVHDSLGHELSLIALRAGALEIAPDLAAHHQQAATELRLAAAAATEQLRTVIGVLREETAGAPTVPVRETIADLVERATASGMTVELEIVGERPPVRPVVDRAAYRVVQESLTNAAKHAPGAPVSVRLDHGGDATTVTVTNVLKTLPVKEGGRGLIGLQERVRFAGGSLTAGPDGGEFVVTARLPYEQSGVRPVVEEPVPYAETTQRRLRRQLAATVFIPVTIGAAVAVVVLGGYLVFTFNSVLAPDAYAGLAVGEDRASVSEVLPPLQMVDPPRTDKPAGYPDADCRYYRTSANLSVDAAYRLCFVGDRLVTLDRLGHETMTQ
ncbi:sensor histidine kinase [Fodinicola acaciae]|uniref:sensor histidine kinase n=1 Tax=Fodinicola acaciae TaxID=2681555 RepID=UPI0013D51980|nr:histidine kinase [Fodinicola acaciae]